MLANTGLLCFSLAVLSLAHRTDWPWNTGDDLAVVAISGILTAIVAAPLRRLSVWPVSLYKSWCLFAALIAGIPCLSYHWAKLLVR